MRSIDRGLVAQGRIALPIKLRQELGIEDGSEVVFSRTAHGIEIQPLAAAVRRTQGRFARFITPAESVVDGPIRTAERPPTVGRAVLDAAALGPQRTGDLHPRKPSGAPSARSR